MWPNAAKVGEPSLVDPEPVAATSVVRKETFAAIGMPGEGRDAWRS